MGTAIEGLHSARGKRIERENGEGGMKYEIEIREKKSNGIEMLVLLIMVLLMCAGIASHMP